METHQRPQLLARLRSPQCGVAGAAEKLAGRCPAAGGGDLGEALVAVLAHGRYIGSTQRFPEHFQPAWTAAILPPMDPRSLEFWDQVHFRPDRVHVVGDERYLVLVESSGRGRGSGVALSGDWLGHLVTLRGGRAARLEVYRGWDEAREAAGVT